MSEDPGHHPPEETPVEQLDVSSPKREPARDVALGCIFAGLLGCLFTYLAVGSIMTAPFNVFIFYLCCVPASGLVLAAIFQGFNRYLARGALVFSVVSFLVVGVCMIPFISRPR